MAAPPVLLHVRALFGPLIAAAATASAAAAAAAAGGRGTCYVRAGCGMAAAGKRGLAEVNASSAAECCAACGAYPGGHCVRWSFSALEPPCHLHDALAHPVVARGHVCGHIPGWVPPVHPPMPPGPPPPSPPTIRYAMPSLHLVGTPGDTVGLLFNPLEARYEVMWDAGSECL